MDNPFVYGNHIRIRLALPCSQEKAWSLIGTPEGYTKWFPDRCRGDYEKGETILMGWWYGETGEESYTILDIVPGQFVEHNWETAPGGMVRYEIEGEDPVVFTLTATYSDSEEGKAGQLLDVAPWSFASLNLKSVAAGGVDLRCRSERPKMAGYLD